VLKYWVKTNSIEKKTESQLQASQEVGLERTTEKTNDVVKFHHQNAGQDHHLLTVNKFYENVAQFKYLRMTITHTNFIHKGIRNRLNTGNAS
jgi:hypothetical protein